MKISISLPDEVHVLAEQAVATGRAASISAYIVDLIREDYDPEALTKLLAFLDTEFGPISDEDRAEGDRLHEAMLADTLPTAGELATKSNRGAA